MARYTFFAVAVATFGILGANAGLCRPTTTTAVAESSTTLAATSTTALVESSTTTLAASTTTTEGPSCIESQVVENPSFDDNSDGAPWSGASLSTENPRTGAKSVHFGFWSGGDGTERTLTQPLSNLEGNFELEFFYGVARATPWSGVALGFSCIIVASVGGREVDRVYVENGGWTASRKIWANPSVSGVVDQAELKFVANCVGEFDELVLAIDDVTFTRACGPLQS